MSSPALNSDPTQDYAFRFDLPIDPIILGGELDVAGWLLHRAGKPIHGLRAVVKRRFSRSEIVRGRRKRKRPDVAAAFPNLPNAEASGFLIELRLRLGRNHLSFQLRDHDRVWHTFSTATVTAIPLSLLERFGFTNLRSFLILYLQQRLAARIPEGHASAGPGRVEARPSGSSLNTKRVELFATSKSNLFIVEIGGLVAAGFRELGCEAQLHLDETPEEHPPEGTVQIVVTPHEFYNLFLSEKYPRERLRGLTAGVHLLCTEQPETGWFQSNLQWGAYARSVADINPLGVAAYRARGLKSHELQLGYHPSLSHASSTPHRERSHDITFLGSMTERRDEFFAQHADFFAQHRCHLRLVPLGFAKTKETRSYLSEVRRNKLLSDSRILLNLHYSEQKYFEWHRMLVGLANGCCIITETCRGHGPLIPGRHFIMVEQEYLIPACRYYLEHPEECEKIARAGLEFVETNLRQSQSCLAFLGSIEGGQTPVSPSDAPAAPLPEELMQRFSRHTRQLLWSALRKDVRGLVNRAPSQDSVVLDQQREPVIAKRNAYKARLEQQEETRSQGESIWRLHDNDLFARASVPRLSVLITLYNYAHHIDECIESIARAAEHLAEPPEVVIVNDASTDDSLARALASQRVSRLPMRIVDKTFNTGLADARNTGLHLSRARYLFMMDADNLVFPTALMQLLDAISESDSVAAYSLLCRFRESPSNRVGLLSYFDWDPQILVQYPYIDAMAMFDRQVLLDLGGYDNHLSQIGWFGWEDYDMWLRFAQHQKRVAFVPNTLCLYRHHDTSMINTTNLFEAELVQHFLDRYGDLLARFEPREKVFGVKREKIAGAAGLL